MIIDNDDISDVKYQRDVHETPEITSGKWLERGLVRFDFLCTSYGIDVTKIPSPANYLVKRIAELCTLIEWCSANVGSDYLVIRDDYSIDVYKTKKHEFEDELTGLLGKFTPKNCGIVEENSDEQSENTNSFIWFRG